MPGDNDRPRGLLVGISSRFLDGRLAPLLILVAVSVGIASILGTPREEDPQIVVPMADIYVSYPGGSAEEVEDLVATPLEKLIWQIDGVEHVYSISRRDEAVITARFYVGTDPERAMVRLRNRIQRHLDEAPPGVSGWLIKPIEIDDVPIVTITLYSMSPECGPDRLRRVGEEVLTRLARVKNTSRTEIVGGLPREIRVELDPERLQARNLSPLEIHRQLQVADASVSAGSFDRGNRHIDVTCGPFLSSREDVAELVVKVHEGRPVYLSDVATVIDGPVRPESYAHIGFGSAGLEESGIPGIRVDAAMPAVTLAIAKKRGTNAVTVADEILQLFRQLHGSVIPTHVRYAVTRNYGETADAKVNDLLSSLLFALLTVVGLLFLFLGWREALVVACSVPITFGLALFLNWQLGYTINRVTLFALILSLGMVVDDPITNVDNIQRHILMRKRGPLLATLWGLHEVLPPVIMSTLTIVVSFLPLFFISGMMGPYMAPMAINVPLTVVFSTVSALTIVPWLAYLLLRHKGSGDASTGRDVVPGWVRSAYRKVLTPLIASKWRGIGFLLVVCLLFVGSSALVPGRLIPLKMLPFDNKNELALKLDMPEGTTLEATAAALQRFEEVLARAPEVAYRVSYAGVASPMDFNDLVRHDYLRRGPNVGEIRVNLVDKSRRRQQSHEIALRLRAELEAVCATLREEQIARGLSGDIQVKIVEVPPGPPVLATLVAEIHGSEDLAYARLISAAHVLKERLTDHAGVHEIDDMSTTPSERLDFLLDKEKAGLHGITTEEVVQTIGLALGGSTPTTVHVPRERQPLLLRVELPLEQRSGGPELTRIAVKGSDGQLVPLAELGSFSWITADQPIYHKDLARVVFVTAEVVGASPGLIVLDLMDDLARHPLPDGTVAVFDSEGEWKITVDVFRDLGLAFGAALIAIYVLIVIETSSFFMPLVIMTAIPLTAIGILPGFTFLNLTLSQPVGGLENPVFFTATAMIGMIALGGIVVRNSIVLIDFIKGAIKSGSTKKEALLESGAVRLRPIVLTAITTALGAWPITLDPIFSGLAWSLIFGLVASTLFTLLVIPVVYSLVYGEGSS